MKNYFYSCAFLKKFSEPKILLGKYCTLFQAGKGIVTEDNDNPRIATSTVNSQKVQETGLGVLLES